MENMDSPAPITLTGQSKTMTITVFFSNPRRAQEKLGEESVRKGLVPLA